MFPWRHHAARGTAHYEKCCSMSVARVNKKTVYRDVHFKGWKQINAVFATCCIYPERLFVHAHAWAECEFRCAPASLHHLKIRAWLHPSLLSSRNLFALGLWVRSQECSTDYRTVNECTGSNLLCGTSKDSPTVLQITSAPVWTLKIPTKKKKVFSKGQTLDDKSHQIPSK